MVLLLRNKLPYNKVAEKQLLLSLCFNVDLKYFFQTENFMGFLFVCFFCSIYTPKNLISHWDSWFQPVVSAVIYATSVWTISNSEYDNIIICKKKKKL